MSTKAVIAVLYRVVREKTDESQRNLVRSSRHRSVDGCSYDALAILETSLERNGILAILLFQSATRNRNKILIAADLLAYLKGYPLFHKKSPSNRVSEAPIQ